MLYKINKSLQKFMPFMTPMSVVLGILFSEWLNSYVFLVPWIFAFMTFSGSLGSNFKCLKNVITYPLPLIACLLVLHLIMPTIALGVGHLVFPGDFYTTTGLVLSFLIPTGITSLIWVSIYRGNVALTLSIILIDTLIAPFIVPYILKIFVGQAIEMNLWDITEGLLWMIVFPSLLGMAMNQVTKGKVVETIEPILSPFSKIGVGLVVGINSSAIAPYFKAIDTKLLLITGIVLSLAVLSYIIGFATGKLLKENWETIISLTYNSGMRNISVGAVIAVTYFPAQVAVPVIVGMLFQQILASFSGVLLNRASDSVVYQNT
ncbi:bile acid:sodium symporter family protein [Pseudalkalibacillus caeni]|uniref:Bile acid:sodium symporter family protein n=1 Tax=Exobacillus caeni TaxID=2574798 RepID=A0A5R9F7E0_9BACL|nr:bile acid:sodium symporter family protein [Pseudalkalibacillus caeni]TLS38439.1 bile acid:sodium symporter family protein [Pseudalkalibacillus caeni]